MTDPTTVTHDAGRELDALIAERVMGLVPCQAAIHGWWGRGACFALPESPCAGGELRAYSTDIDAAWEVVRAIRQRFGAYVQVEDGHPFGGGFARFVRKGEAMVDRPTLRWDAAADTVPLAICRAALRVRGEEPQ